MELADAVGLAGMVVGAFGRNENAPRKYKVGNAEFEENHVIGPAGPIAYNIRTTADGEGVKYSATIRIGTDLDDKTCQEYLFLADKLRKWPVLKGTKDEFISIAETGVLAYRNKSDYSGYCNADSNGKLEVRVQNEPQENINEQFIEKLKKNRAWQRYFFNVTGGSASDVFVTGTLTSIVTAICLAGSAAITYSEGYLNAGSVALVAIGGAVTSALAGVGVSYVLKKMLKTRQARFYRECKDESRIERFLMGLDETLARYERWADKCSSNIGYRKDDIRRLKERLLVLENDGGSISQYVERKNDLLGSIGYEEGGIAISEEELKKHRERMAGLYWLAGELADKESRKRGLIITYTADTPEKVREFVKSLAEKPEEKQEMPQAEAKPTEKPKIEDYELLEQIGEGGIGKVYKARKGEETVTIKVPHQDAKKFFERDQTTLDAIMALEHPNIARVKKVQTEGQAFEVREYVEGKSLDKMIKDARNIDASLNILRQMASGLAYAHEKGIIHGDMKPQNVLVGDVVKIADFDLSRVHDPNEIALSLTRTGVVGTFDYMAPEQREGKLATMQTDVYSFGAVAFELLTSVSKNATRKPMHKLNPAITSEIIEMVERCLETDAKERYQNMQEVVRALSKPQKEERVPQENKNLQKITMPAPQEGKSLQKITEQFEEELE